MDLPDDIIIEQLPGPERGKYPCIYFQDEVIWSPGRTHLALAYTICEASMCNNVGSMLWAKVDGRKVMILQNPRRVLASCWRSPWCRWLSECTFVFKAQNYTGKTTCVPLVAIDVMAGFQVLPGTNTGEIWVDHAPPLGEEWIPFDENELLKRIESST